jgi:hypothetical protein
MSMLGYDVPAHDPTRLLIDSVPTWPPIQNERPVVSVEDQTVAVNEFTQLQSVLAAYDSDGDAITRYLIRDSEGSQHNFWVDGVGYVDASNNTLFDASWLPAVWFQGDAQLGSQNLWVRGYDGREWSDWDPFVVTTTASTLPVVAQKAVTTEANSDEINGGTGGAKTLFNLSDDISDVVTLTSEAGVEIEFLTDPNFTIELENMDIISVDGGGGSDSLTVGNISNTPTKLVEFTGGEGGDALIFGPDVGTDVTFTDFESGDDKIVFSAQPAAFDTDGNSILDVDDEAVSIEDSDFVLDLDGEGGDSELTVAGITSLDVVSDIIFAELDLLGSFAEGGEILL